MRRLPASVRVLLRLLAAGAVLWLLLDRLAPSSERIVVGQDVRRALRADLQRRTGRPPSDAEARAALDAWIEDELLYREALALGLDRSDVVVRRRLIQSMRFLLEDEGPEESPSDDELRVHLERDRARWIVPARTTFTHVFRRDRSARDADAADTHTSGDREAHGTGDEAGTAATTALRAQLESDADPATVGDPFPRGSRFTGADAAEIDRVFGPGFAARLAVLPPGTWSGPVRSSYGWHLVRVESRAAAREPALDEIRAELTADWKRARRDERRRGAIAALRARYDVVDATAAASGDRAGADRAGDERGVARAAERVP